MASAGRGRGGRLLQSVLTSKQKQEGVEEQTEPKQQTIAPEAVVAAEEPVQKPPSPPRPTIRSMGRGILRTLARPSTSEEPQRQPSISPTSESKAQQQQQQTQERKSPSQEAQQQITQEAISSEPVSNPVKPPLSRGRGIVSRLGQTVAPLPSGIAPQREREPSVGAPITTRAPTGTDTTSLTTRFESVQITETRVTTSVAIEQTPQATVVPPPAPSAAPTIISSSADDRARMSTTTSGESRVKYLSVASTGSKSVEKAMAELNVEHVMRSSPVRRAGSDGTTELYATNYVKLKCKNQGVYQYVVNFDPPLDSQRLRAKLIYQMSDIIGPVRLFDGYTLFLPKILDNPTIGQVTTNTGEQITVQIRLTKMLPPEQIPDAVFSIIFKNIMKELKMSRIGQHYFSPSRQIDIRNQGLTIWPGYTTAVHEFEDGLYLVVDVAHKVLRSETCYDMIADIQNRLRNDPSAVRQEVYNALVGNIVLTKYNNRTYKIDDIMWDENPLSEFQYKNEMISYKDYYKKHYDIVIHDLKQPLLFHRPKEKASDLRKSGNRSPTEAICLIPELCFMTGLTDAMRSDMNVKKELGSHTRLSPEQRYQQLQAIVDQIRSNEKANKFIQDWGLELEQDLSSLDGRVLPPEKIIFGRREVTTDARCDWTRACSNEEVVRGVPISNWMCVYPAKREDTVAKFAELAIEVGRKIGVRMDMPLTVPLRDDKPDTYYNEIKKNIDSSIQMIVIVLPMLSDSRYTRVKRLCCIENSIPSQVIVLKTISKPDNVLRTVAQKIVLQMNVKLGGELWRLSIPIKKMMIVGIDVYHKIDKKYQSIAGFVSSMNHDQTRWYSRVCFQMTGQELADSLKVAFAQSLKKYQEVNGFLPDKIFVFRDGVSEGQIARVTDHEVAQLKSCFSNDYCPSMSVIVVQKRISTRIFAQGPERGIVNPKPGAIVDTGVTSKDMFDFYIVSQHVSQGTVTPTHYVVAYDDTNYKPDYLQRLSYKMTHMYYNWSGTIRVPAPCQYAHKLAFLTGQYLQSEAQESLCDRLFYL